jgi:hypothetical protein
VQLWVSKEPSIIFWRKAVGLLEMAIEGNEEEEKKYRDLFEQAITLLLRAVKLEADA